MFLTISPAGEFGFVPDLPPYELANNAWSDAKNVRFESGAVKAAFGFARAMNPESGTPLSGTPLGLHGFSSDETAYWIVSTTNKLLLTSLTGAVEKGTGYTATDAFGWQKTVLNGIAVLNNPNDQPQAWTVGDAAAFANLPNWTSTWRARRVIAYKNFLVALNVTKGATAYPTLVKWSHAADPGQVPSSWDETDPTKDAGEVPLGDGFDEIIDAEVMGDTLFIFKRRSVWGMQFVGGTFIFRHWPVFQDIGLISPRCIVNLPGRQFFISYESFVVHNGQTWEEVSDRKTRRYFFKDLNYQYVHKAYCLHNSARNEIWIFYPSIDSTGVDKVLIWNYKENTWMPRTYGFTPVSGDLGRLTDYNTDAWDSDPGGWTSDTLPWDFGSYALYSFKLVTLGSDLVLRVLDVGTTDDGADIESYVVREALALPSRADKPIDLGDLKFVRGVYPKITGETGAVVEVYVGSQHQIDEDVVWSGPFSYTVGTTKFIPCRVTGRLISIKFRSSGTLFWQIQSYQFDYGIAGRF